MLNVTPVEKEITGKKCNADTFSPENITQQDGTKIIVKYNV
jgi:hypothetical protein